MNNLEVFNYARLYAEIEALKSKIKRLEQEIQEMHDTLTVAYMKGYSDGKAKLKGHKSNE